MTDDKPIPPVPTRQGDRNRLNLWVLRLSLPAAFVLLLVTYLMFLR